MSRGKQKNAAAPARSPDEPKRRSAVILAALVMAAVVVAAALLWNTPASELEPQPTAPPPGGVSQSEPGAPSPSPQPPAPKHPAKSASPGRPPLPWPSHGRTARPVEVVEAVYGFAADHPEVLRYVPCFCGCERSGHLSNHDCFVRERDPATGRVSKWDAHAVT